MNKHRIFLAALLVSASLLFASCESRRNPLANTMWRFVYTETDYTIFSFSEFYFAITDYRIAENGQGDFYEVTGSYEAKNGVLKIEGENGKMVIDGEVLSNAFLRHGWDGEYYFHISGNTLVITRGDADVTLSRMRY